MSIGGWRISVRTGFIVAALVAVALTPEPMLAAGTVDQEGAGFLACLACALGAGLVTGAAGLLGLLAVLTSVPGMLLAEYCYNQCKELFDAVS